MALRAQAAASIVVLFASTDYVVGFGAFPLAVACGAPSEQPSTEPTPRIGQVKSEVATGTADNGSFPTFPYVGQWTGPLGTCSGTLITSQWVLTAAHCFNGWEGECLTDLIAGPPFSTPPNYNTNFTINFGNGIVGVHTAAVSGPALTRTTKLFNACDNSDTAMDVALFKLDVPIKPWDVIPMHPPLSSNPGDWCSARVGDADDFDGVLVGYGGLGVRNAAASADWNLEFMDPGFIYRNHWGLDTYQGLQPGDSGGPLLTDAIWQSDFLLPEPRLCGINSRSYYVFPGFGTNASSDAAVDVGDNRTFIEQAVLRPDNPNGRPDGGFQGERLPQQELFAVGTDGLLHVRSTVDHYIFQTAWKLAGSGNNGVPLTKVSAVSWGPQRMDAFAIASNNVIDHAFSEDGGASFGWDSWGSPSPGSPLKGLDVVSGRPGRLDLFVTVTVRTQFFNSPITQDFVALRSWDNGTDSGWHWVGAPTLGGFLSGPGAAAAALGPDRLDVYVTTVGTSPIRLKHAYSNDAGATFAWDDWTPSGFTITGEPDAATWGPNRLDVFVAGGDGSLRHVWWQNGSSGWDNWGKLFASSVAFSPTVVSMGPGSLTVGYGTAAGSLVDVPMQNFHMPPGSSAPVVWPSSSAYDSGWLATDIDLSSR